MPVAALFDQKLDLACGIFDGRIEIASDVNWQVTHHPGRFRCRSIMRLPDRQQSFVLASANKLLEAPCCDHASFAADLLTGGYDEFVSVLGRAHAYLQGGANKHHTALVCAT